jgi:hypothetical protein
MHPENLRALTYNSHILNGTARRDKKISPQKKGNRERNNKGWKNSPNIILDRQFI